MRATEVHVKVYKKEMSQIRAELNLRSTQSDTTMRMACSGRTVYVIHKQHQNGSNTTACLGHVLMLV